MKAIIFIVGCFVGSLVGGFLVSYFQKGENPNVNGLARPPIVEKDIASPNNMLADTQKPDVIENKQKQQKFQFGIRLLDNNSELVDIRETGICIVMHSSGAITGLDGDLITYDQLPLLIRNFSERNQYIYLIPFHSQTKEVTMTTLGIVMKTFSEALDQCSDEVVRKSKIQLVVVQRNPK